MVFAIAHRERQSLGVLGVSIAYHGRIGGIRLCRVISIDNRIIQMNFRFLVQDVRFMSELFRIVNGALRLDIDKVRNYTAFLAD